MYGYVLTSIADLVAAAVAIAVVVVVAIVVAPAAAVFIVVVMFWDYHCRYSHELLRSALF